MSKQTKYDIANEFALGFAGSASGFLPRLGTAHFLAGWDAGYKSRPQKQDALNQYLKSIGMDEMAIISTATAPAAAYIPSAEE